MASSVKDIADPRAEEPPPPDPPPTSAPVDSSRPELRLVSDAPLSSDSEDLLGFSTYANALHGIIVNPETSTPLTIALNAPWGAGKSSLAKLICARLEERTSLDKQPHTVCWFNAWEHHDSPSIPAALTAAVTRAAVKARPWYYHLAPLPSSLLTSSQRLDRRLRCTYMGTITLLLLLYFLSVFCPLRLFHAVDWLLDLPPFARPEFAALSGTLTLASLFAAMKLAEALYNMAAPVAQEINKFIHDPEESAKLANQSEVRNEVANILRAATTAGRRFVVVIDDLERCNPKKTVDVLEALNLIFSQPNVVIIILADQNALAAAAELNYKSLAALYVPQNGFALSNNSQKLAFGHAFLRKIIQLQVDIPLAHDMAPLMSAFATQRSSDETQPSPEKRSLRAAIQRLRLSMKYTWSSDRTLLGGLRSTLSKETRRSAITIFLLWLFLLPEIALHQLVWTHIGVHPSKKRYAPEGRFKKYGMPVVVTSAFLCIIAQGLLLASFFDFAFAPYRLFYIWLVMGTLAAFTITQVVFWAGSRIIEARLVSNCQKFIEKRIAAEKQLGGNVDYNAIRAEAAAEFKIPIAGGLLDELLQREIINDTTLLQNAYNVVLPYLPPLPRSMKQILNRLRLFLYVAHVRELLTSSNRTSALAQIGKWVALCERWPELSAAITLRPKAILDLQANAHNQKLFFNALRTVTPHYRDDATLHAFCNDNYPFNTFLPSLLTLSCRP